MSLSPARKRAFISLNSTVRPTRCRRIFPAGRPTLCTTVWPTPPPPTAISTAWSAPGTAASAFRQRRWPRADAAACTPWTRPAPCGWRRCGCPSRSLHRIQHDRLPKHRQSRRSDRQHLSEIIHTGGTHYGKDDHHFGT